MIMTPPDDSNEPKPNSMEEALRMAENTARSWSSSHEPRGNPNGVLYRFGAENANPNAQGFKQLNKLRDRIESILNNVSVSIGGRPTQNAKREGCSAYEDFFEKGHREEFKFGHAELAIEVRFSIPGSLKLVIRNLTAEYLAKESEQNPNPLQRNNDRFSLDALVGLHYNPTRDSLGNSYCAATLPGNEHAMSTVFMSLAMFADANNLAFYVQGMCTESLTYVFLDQDLMR